MHHHAHEQHEHAVQSGHHGFFHHPTAGAIPVHHGLFGTKTASGTTHQPLGATHMIDHLSSFHPSVQTASAHEVARLPTGRDIVQSDLSGSRRAVFIGINYVGSQHALRGCWNDVQNVKQFVAKYGFVDTPQTMLTLTDEPTTPSTLKPTRENILNALKWLVTGAKAGDCLMLHYSGHGCTTPEPGPDFSSPNGMADAIAPVDFEQNGFILDHELHTMLAKPLPQGVRLFALMDCCHSGSIFDLPYTWIEDPSQPPGTQVHIDNRQALIAHAMTMGKAFLAGDKASIKNELIAAAKEHFAGGGGGSGQGLSAIFSALNTKSAASGGGGFGGFGSFFQSMLAGQPVVPAGEQTPYGSAPSNSAPQLGHHNSSGHLETAVRPEAVAIETTVCEIYVLSGCRDDQTSADATIASRPTGALSYSFLKSFEIDQQQTWSDLLLNVRNELQKGGFSQVPQLSVGYKMEDLTQQFNI